MERLQLVPAPSQAAVADPGEENPDEDLVAALCQAVPGARAALVARYGDHLRRVLVRLLGADDPDRPDLLQDVFMRAFKGIKQLQSADALKPWLTRIAVFVAREHIRRRRRRRWLLFLGEVPEAVEPTNAADAAREAVRCVYAVLDSMAVDERTVFVLHVFEGYELKDLVEICDMSYATIRRRFAHAQAVFLKKAARYEALQPWMEGSR